MEDHPTGSGSPSPQVAYPNVDDALIGLWDLPQIPTQKSTHSRMSSECLSFKDISVPRTPSPGPMCYEFMGEALKMNSMNSMSSVDEGHGGHGGGMFAAGTTNMTPNEGQQWGSYFPPFPNHSAYPMPTAHVNQSVQQHPHFLQPLPFNGHYNWMLSTPNYSVRRGLGEYDRSDDMEEEESPVNTIGFLAPQPPDPLQEDDIHTPPKISRPRGVTVGGAPYGGHEGKGATTEGNHATAGSKRAANQNSPQKRKGDSRSQQLEPHSERRNGMLQDKEGKGGRRRGKDSYNTVTDDTLTGSRFLDEFRQHGSVDTVRLCAAGPSTVLEFARDQYGSRFLQQKVESAAYEDKQLIFDCLRDETVNLSQDVFGNYVIQKFFDFGSRKQIKALTNLLLGSVLHLSLHMYGCRVIQKALEWCSLDLQLLLMKEVQCHVLECVEDQNGNHVIQKCIERMPANQISFIVREIASSDLVSLSKHCYGCRVLQRVIEHCMETDLAPIYDSVILHWRALSSDPYGNYVIQHIMEHGREADKRKIINKMRPQIQQLACDKFASNVLERALSTLPKKDRALLSSAIMSHEGDIIMELSRDCYGNYIVQRMLEICTGAEKESLMTILERRKNDLKGIAYGKHIVTALDRARGRSSR
eukprot:GEMP01007658.1.p1 GENE.GEMP01007658.1~~GEMP01007658.1.p1  ORF type:complete len:653 (+),score=101.96 GEMP01007658.1:34-1959(+)